MSAKFLGRDYVEIYCTESPDEGKCKVGKADKGATLQPHWQQGKISTVRKPQAGKVRERERENSSHLRSESDWTASSPLSLDMTSISVRCWSSSTSQSQSLSIWRLSISDLWSLHINLCNIYYIFESRISQLVTFWYHYRQGGGSPDDCNIKIVIADCQQASHHHQPQTEDGCMQVFSVR